VLLDGRMVLGNRRFLLLCVDRMNWIQNASPARAARFVSRDGAARTPTREERPGAHAGARAATYDEDRSALCPHGRQVRLQMRLEGAHFQHEAIKASEEDSPGRTREPVGAECGDASAFRRKAGSGSGPFEGRRTYRLSGDLESGQANYRTRTIRTVVASPSAAMRQ
jgi:hypothetical protein